MEENKYKKIYDSKGDKKIHTPYGDLFIDFGIYEAKEDGTLLWMEHEEQVHMTPMKSINEHPINIRSISESSVANMLREMYSFKIKKKVDINEIKEKNKELINSILKELKGKP